MCSSLNSRVKLYRKTVLEEVCSILNKCHVLKLIVLLSSLNNVLKCSTMYICLYSNHDCRSVDNHLLFLFVYELKDLDLTFRLHVHVHHLDVTFYASFSIYYLIGNS
jgi:hypothetical protein